jgi:hypothetical protein
MCVKNTFSGIIFFQNAFHKNSSGPDRSGLLPQASLMLLFPFITLL